MNSLKPTKLKGGQRTGMGQCTSSNRLDRSSSLGKLYYGSLRKSRRGPLSATFHIDIEKDLQWELLNVNTATEEELMTLPGISRTIARNVVNYRQTISGFKKVEDLALVSGIGAAKLELFRSEICVVNKRRSGKNIYPSEDQSLDSLSNVNSNGYVTQSSQSKLVDVNTANVFELMGVRGITQEMAANIVHHRDKKGPFKRVDDLAKVKGISLQKMASVRSFVTADNISLNRSETSLSVGTPQSRSGDSFGSHHRRTCSAPPIQCSTSKPLCFNMTEEVYKVLSSYSKRPNVGQHFSQQYRGQEAFRMGAWNLHQFSVNKAKNPGVQEVICRTIVENGLTLLAVQDVESSETIRLVQEELNTPSLPLVRSWEHGRGKWEYTVPRLSALHSKHTAKLGGFLYDTSHGLELQDSFLLAVPEELNDGGNISPPLIGRFKRHDAVFVSHRFLE